MALRDDLVSNIYYLINSAYTNGSSYAPPPPSLPRPVGYELDMQVLAGQPAHSAPLEILLSWLTCRWAAQWHGGSNYQDCVSIAQMKGLKAVAVDRFSLELRCRLQVEDFVAMWCAEASAMGLAVASLTVNGGAAGLGVFSLRGFPSGFCLTLLTVRSSTVT